MTCLSLFANSSKRRFRFDEIGHKLIRLSVLKKLDTEPVKTGSFRFFNPQSKKGSILKPGQNFRSAARSQKKLLEKKVLIKKKFKPSLDFSAADLSWVPCYKPCPVLKLLPVLVSWPVHTMKKIVNWPNLQMSEHFFH